MKPKGVLLTALLVLAGCQCGEEKQASFEEAASQAPQICQAHGQQALTVTTKDCRQWAAVCVQTSPYKPFFYEIPQ